MRASFSRLPRGRSRPADPGLRGSSARGGGVHAKLEPLQLRRCRAAGRRAGSAWAIPKRFPARRPGPWGSASSGHCESEISLVYQVRVSGQPVKEREVYRYVKPSGRHSVSVVSGKRAEPRGVDGRRIGHRIQMQPGDGWRAFTTVESAVRLRRVRHAGLRGEQRIEGEAGTDAAWDQARLVHAHARLCQDSGPLLRQQSLLRDSSSARRTRLPDPSASKLTWAPPRLSVSDDHRTHWEVRAASSTCSRVATTS